MTAPPILLASTSPYRREQLERLGIEFTCIAPNVDEAAFKSDPSEPSELAAALARAKAFAVAAQRPDAIVIAGDQVCAAGQELLGKPGNELRARQQLEQLSGRTHELHSAACLRLGAQMREHVATASMRMRKLDAAALARYVERERPFDCAGSYKIESRGLALFDAIDAPDSTAIVGLPLLFVVRTLVEFGVRIP